MPGRVVALAGGVGGAKLAEGLQALVGDGLAVVVNTGDDCARHGLVVMPDHDTVLYNLAGIEQAGLGWGIEGDSRVVMDELVRYGEPGWFTLTDRDLALHVARTARLGAGGRRTEVCLGLQAAHGIAARILPMSDAPVATEVRTDDGWLEFQDWFVRRRAEPEVREIRFAGIAEAAPSPEVLAALEAAEAIVVCPSNPLVSIAPILAVPGLRAAIERARARGVPVVAVSPIVGGRALKGPADRMLAALGDEVSAAGIARRYAGLANLLVIDEQDAELAPAVAAAGPRPVVAPTVMHDDAARIELARVVLEAAAAAAPVARPGPIAPEPAAAPTVAIVPVRTLEGAKSRLGAVLDAEERRDLVVRLLRRTVAAALATPGIARVVVVSPDPEALAVAAAAGAEPLLQVSRGLNPALREARAAAPDAARLLVVPGDLPELAPAELTALLAAADEAGRPSVVIAPDRHGRGTNALVLTPPAVIDPAFGGDSRAAHGWLARAAGARFVEAAGLLRLDLDTPDDLLLAEGSAADGAGTIGGGPHRPAGDGATAGAAAGGRAGGARRG